MSDESKPADDPKVKRPKWRDEVEEASDGSFPASDPPSYTAAEPRDKPLEAKRPPEPAIGEEKSKTEPSK